MTAEEHALKFLEMYPNLPSPVHHPKLFNYYLRLYKFNHELKKSS